MEHSLDPKTTAFLVQVFQEHLEQQAKLQDARFTASLPRMVASADGTHYVVAMGPVIVERRGLWSDDETAAGGQRKVFDEPAAWTVHVGHYLVATYPTEDAARKVAREIALWIADGDHDERVLFVAAIDPDDLDAEDEAP